MQRTILAAVQAICQTTDCTSVTDGTKCFNELGRYIEKRNTRVIAFNDVILMWLFRIWLPFVCWVLSYDSKLMEKNNTQIDCILLSDDVITVMTSSLRKVACMFRIKFPTKRIFRIFPILRTDGMAPFGTYLWNDPRIHYLSVPWIFTENNILHDEQDSSLDSSQEVDSSSTAANSVLDSVMPHGQNLEGFEAEANFSRSRPRPKIKLRIKTTNKSISWRL